MKLTKKFNTILKAFLATLLYILGIELIGSWFLIAEAIQFEGYLKYYYLIQGALQLLAVLLFMFFKRNKTFKNLIEETHFKWYFFSVILGFSFVFLQTPLNWIYNSIFGTEYSIVYRFDGLLKFKDLYWISSIILIPVGEELFFRGYIQNSLHKKTSVTIAVLLASLLFAAIHLPYLNLILDFSKQDGHLFYQTFFGGLISSLLYLKSKSIGPSIIFHVSWNLMVMIV